MICINDSREESKMNHQCDNPPYGCYACHGCTDDIC